MPKVTVKFELKIRTAVYVLAEEKAITMITYANKYNKQMHIPLMRVK